MNAARGGPIAVAMSGGVDSTTAALLLAEAGHRVVGLTMRLAPEGATGADAPVRAAAAAARLGIPHRVVDLRRPFLHHVVRPFAHAYCRGLTPNPCARCNVTVKFGALAGAAGELGFPVLATGHYVRRVPAAERGRFRLLKGLDPGKDQSYFLFGLSQDQLALARFPLGELTKDEVRALAARHGLPESGARESQDICFLEHFGDNDLPALAERFGAAPGAGKIVNAAGEVLGTHSGIHRYTVGQRRGLDLPSSRPWYVLRLDAATNCVVVGREEELYRRRLLLDEVSWIPAPPPALPLAGEVRIRYRHPGARATIRPGHAGRLLVHFDEPQRAITPGQAAAIYDGEEVLGGGWILPN